jgi:hypothetical protein
MSMDRVFQEEFNGMFFTGGTCSATNQYAGVRFGSEIHHSIEHVKLHRAMLFWIVALMVD